MMFSGTPFSAVPLSSTLVDLSVASLFSGLIADQDAPRAYLIDCRPYDTVGLAEVEVGFSVGLQRPILDGRMWAARIGTVVNAEVNLFSDDIGSGGSSSFGIIKVLIGDGDNDDILDYTWDGRDVTVLMGAEGFDFSEFQAVYVGKAYDITYTDRVLSIILRDKAELLRVPVQDSLYSGLGGLNGGDDLAGQPKPLCYGICLNVQPVLVDRANLVYQVHDGAIAGVDDVFDGALALTPAGDVADITLTSVTAGQYKTQLSGGYIKLGAEPSKALTADVRGDNTGGYVDTAADVVKRVVLNHTTLLAADINAQSVADVNTANSSAVGWYGAATSVDDIVGHLMESVGGSYVFNRAGEMYLSVFQFTTSAGTIEQVDIMSLRRERTLIPTWRRHVGYALANTVQGQNDVVAGATTARKDFVATQYRRVTSEDAAIKTRRLLARTITVDTLLNDATDAQTEANRQQVLFGAERQRFTVTTKRQQFKYRAGQTITVSYPRFGFPRECIILGIVEDTDKRFTEFRVLA